MEWRTLDVRVVDVKTMETVVGSNVEFLKEVSSEDWMDGWSDEKLMSVSLVDVGEVELKIDGLGDGRGLAVPTGNRDVDFECWRKMLNGCC